MASDAQPQTQTYAISNGYRLILRVSLGVFLLFGVAFIGLLWLAVAPESFGGVGPYLVVGVGSGLFFVLAVAVWWTLKQIPFCAVTADEEGLWPAHREREEALVPWDAIADVRQHAARRFLELLDERGDRLLRLEYQLEGYGDLRRRVLEHLRHTVRVDLPEPFYRPARFYIFQFSLAAGLVALGVYLAGHNMFAALILLAVAVVRAGNAILTLRGLTLDRDHLTVHYPFRTETVPYETVEDVALVDWRGQGTVQSMVRVTFTDGRNPLNLSGLGLDDTVLCAKIWKAAM
jgi:hypothetical protein